MKEKLQEYALLAEIISAIAVVASLLFVALQINQSNTETSLNTRAIQVSAYQDLISQISEINYFSMQDPDIYRIEAKLEQGLEFEDALEERKYRSFFRLIVRHSDMAFFEYKSGVIDQTQLNDMLGPLRVNLSSYEYSRSVWTSSFGTVAQDFRDYVNDMMLEEGVDLR